MECFGHFASLHQWLRDFVSWFVLYLLDESFVFLPDHIWLSQPQLLDIFDHLCLHVPLVVLSHNCCSLCLGPFHPPVADRKPQLAGGNI